MPIAREKLLALWDLDTLPACDEGMDLAKRFLERAGEAVDQLDSPEAIISLRNALIRAHKELVFHRGGCPKCNESALDE